MFFNNHIGDKGFDFEVLIVFELFDVSQVNETHKVPNVVIVIDFVLIRDGFKKKKKKLMEFSIKGPDPPSQHPKWKKKKRWSKNALNHLK